MNRNGFFIEILWNIYFKLNFKFCRDGEQDDRNYRAQSEQKSNSDGENFINPASFL